MLIEHTLRGFELHDQLVFNKKVGKKFAEQSAVLVVNVKWVLLEYIKPLLSQPVDKSVFVDFLSVAVTVVAMEGKTRFPDDITKLVYMREFHGSVFVSFRVFRGKNSAPSLRRNNAFGLAAGAQVEDRHANGDTIGHLLQDHAAITVS